MKHTLEAQALSFAYEPGSPVLRQVDAAIRGGEVAGIVGPNGSGKSTLLRLLSGLLKGQSGQVLLDGRPLTSFSSRERAKVIAFLPQFVNPAFALSAFEVVCLGRYPHLGSLGTLGPHDREVAERCMRDTETETLRSRDFLTLSGGERQRVLLASILAQEPDLLLLDEPTSALDIHHQADFFALVRRLARDGYGVGVVTHDLNVAGEFCDRLFLMGQEASPIAQGEPEAVLTEELLSRAYSARILVSRHPITNTPLVYPEQDSREEGEAAC
jgi:cobalamin transport system ATP-binding protein